MRSVVALSLLLSIGLSTKHPFYAVPAEQLVWAKRVYSRLLQTIGNPSNPPILRIFSSNKGISEGNVVYRPGNPGRIDLSENVLILCREFGPDADAALACVLGHELAHFQHRHGAKQGFFSPIILGEGSAYSSENLEALADKSGIFTAYLAGYEAFSIAPILYERLYQTFRLRDQLPGYPPKTRRVRMVADTSARVRELAQLFEAGELSYLLGDYEGAGRVFSRLLGQYPNALTRNNLGVSKLNQALVNMPRPAQMPRLGYAFPIEFDTDNRLLSLPRRGEPVPYQQLLTEASQLFDAALAEQPNLQTLSLNKAITDYLLDKPALARQRLESLQPISANAHLMLAIALADLNQAAPAQRAFAQAVRQKAFRAAENQRHFAESQKFGLVRYWNQLTSTHQARQQQANALPAWPDRPLFRRRVALLELPGGIRVAQTDSMTVFELPVTMQPEAGPKSSVRSFRIMKSSRLRLAGLAPGSQVAQLKQYGPPMSTVAGARNTIIYIYRQGTNQLFLEYCDDRLKSWAAVAPI